MSAFDFNSAPGRGGGIQSTMVDLAVMKWSRDQLFGNDATTQAVRAQTALQENQFRYERGMNTLQAFADKFQSKLQYAGNLITSGINEIDDFYDCSFLQSQYEQCSNMYEEFVEGIRTLLTQAKFKKADKFHDEYYGKVIDSLARLVACSEFYISTARSLQEQDLQVTKTFINSSYYKWSIEVVPTKVSNLIQDMTDLSDSGTWETFLVFSDDKLNSLGSSINEVIHLHQKANEIYGEGQTIVDNYISVQKSHWETLTKGDQEQVKKLPEIQQTMVTNYSQELDCEEKWLAIYGEINSKLDRLEKRLKDKLLAKAIKPASKSDSQEVGNNIDALVKLAGLLEKGLISQSDFDSQKAKLLR